MATITWKVNSGGNWSTAADWSRGGIPQAGDSVVISTAQITVTYDSASPSVSVASLTVGDDNFDVPGGGTLSITTSASFGGLLEVDAGHPQFQLGQRLHRLVRADRGHGRRHGHADGFGRGDVQRQRR